MNAITMPLFDFVNRHPNALVDTSPQMVANTGSLRAAGESVGARQIMWGTDWLFSRLNSWRVIQDQCSFLSEADKALMISGNSVRFVQAQV